MAPRTQTTQENPVDLPVRLEGDLQPVPGCAHCDNVALERDRARANGDGSKQSDCNVRMSRHLADAHG